MALPAHKLTPLPDPPRFPREVPEEPSEAVFRPLRKPNGEVVVEKLPLTLDVLLNPREEDQMTQSKYHERQLGPFADSLERCLERREGVAVFSDMLILWKQLGGGCSRWCPRRLAAARPARLPDELILPPRGRLVILTRHSCQRETGS